MISPPLPLPGPTPPGPAPANAAPPAPPASESPEQKPGGFARLLDRAREEPAAPPAAEQAGETPADKTARGRTPLRTGLARPTAPKAEAPIETMPPPHDRGDSAAMNLLTEQTPAEAAPPPSSTPTDTAALLASLAAFARPQPAPEIPAGKAAKAGAEAGQTPGRLSPGATRLPAHMQADAAAASVTTAHAAAADALAADPGGARAGAGSTMESRVAADAGTPAASRSFAAELQATLAGPVPAPPAAPLAATAHTAAAAPAAQGQLAASPGSPAFAPELGATLATFVREGVHHARLELNPAQMGPLTVQIQLDGQAAQVHLAAQNADTRQALEQAMPTLAGSLREAGLTLSGGGVFEQPRQPQQEAPATGRGASGDRERGQDDGRDLQAPVMALRRRGVVDLVA